MEAIGARLSRGLEDPTVYTSVFGVVVARCEFHFLNGGIRGNEERVPLDDLRIIDAFQYVAVVIRLGSVDVYIKVFARVFRVDVELTRGHRHTRGEKCQPGDVIAKSGKSVN